MENKFLLCLWSIIGTILLIVSCTAIITYHVRVIKMAELGYCETQGIGISTLFWSKCK